MDADATGRSRSVETVDWFRNLFRSDDCLLLSLKHSTVDCVPMHSSRAVHVDDEEISGWGVRGKPRARSDLPPRLFDGWPVETEPREVFAQAVGVVRLLSHLPGGGEELSAGVRQVGR